MLPRKVREFKTRDRLRNGRKLICTKCGEIMRDCEPACYNGDFYHHANGCANGVRGKSYDWEISPRNWVWQKADGTQVKSHAPVKPHGIQVLMDKKNQRARRRGARLASKYRPKREG